MANLLSADSHLSGVIAYNRDIIRERPETTRKINKAHSEDYEEDRDTSDYLVRLRKI